MTNDHKWHSLIQTLHINNFRQSDKTQLTSFAWLKEINKVQNHNINENPDTICSMYIVKKLPAASHTNSIINIAAIFNQLTSPGGQTDASVVYDIQILGRFCLP